MDFTDNDAPFDDFSVDNSELNFNAPDEPEDFLLNATDNLGHAQILFQSNAPNMGNKNRWIVLKTCIVTTVFSPPCLQINSLRALSC